jgi:hypothetical protein
MRKMNMGSSGKDAPNGHSPAQEQRLAPSWGSRVDSWIPKAQGTSDHGNIAGDLLNLNEIRSIEPRKIAGTP